MAGLYLAVISKYGYQFSKKQIRMKQTNNQNRMPG